MMHAALGPLCIVISKRIAQLSPEHDAQQSLGWSAQRLQAASGSVRSLPNSTCSATQKFP